MSPNRVIILMATYNGERYLLEQIQSLQNQTYKNWQLIIRDDNSSDRSLKIIEEALTSDDRISILNDNLGNVKSAQNFSILLEHVKSTDSYIMFCDQDDIWMEDKVEKSLIEMKKLEKEFGANKPLVVYGTYRMINENRNYLPLAIPDYSTKPTLNLLLSQNYIYGCTMMINNKLLNLSIPIPESAENHDYWIVLVSITNQGLFKYLKEPLLLYRQHESNVSGSFKNSFMLNRLKRIFNTTESQYIKKRILMFKSLEKRIEEQCCFSSKLLSGFTVNVSKGSFYAFSFCFRNKIKRRRPIQTLFFYLNLLRTRKLS